MGRFFVKIALTVVVLALWTQAGHANEGNENEENSNDNKLEVATQGMIFSLNIFMFVLDISWVDVLLLDLSGVILRNVS